MKTIKTFLIFIGILSIIGFVWHFVLISLEKSNINKMEQMLPKSVIENCQKKGGEMFEFSFNDNDFNSLEYRCVKKIIIN